MQRTAEITCKKKQTKTGSHLRGDILKLLWFFCTICHCPLIFLHLSTSFRDSQFSSVAQWCPTPCDPMDCSMPDFLVQYQLSGLSEILISSNVLCTVFRVIFLKISLWPLRNFDQLVHLSAGSEHLCSGFWNYLASILPQILVSFLKYGDFPFVWLNCVHLWCNCGVTSSLEHYLTFMDLTKNLIWFPTCALLFP